MLGLSAGEPASPGLGVRPSARGRHLAAQVLLQVLPVAAGMGIDRVLVTCDLPNVASARTIERCGGVHERDLQGKRRCWVGTGATVGTGLQ